MSLPHVNTAVDEEDIDISVRNAAHGAGCSTLPFALEALALGGVRARRSANVWVMRRSDAERVQQRIRQRRQESTDGA